MKQKIANNNHNYKFLIALIAIYISCFPLIQIGLHKPLNMGFFHISAGSIIFPIAIVLTDIIAEVYGYNVAKKLIWAHIPATIFYLVMLQFIISIPTTSNWTHQNAYDYIFNGATVVGLLGNLGIVIGFMLNVRVLSRWKILVQGRYFWLRSIGASAIGEFIQLSIGTIGMIYVGMWHGYTWINAFVSVFMMRLIMAGLLSSSATIMVFILKHLKHLENLDVYDYEINYKPFATSATQPS